MIVGYEPSTAALGGIGRLLLAAYKGDDLVYVGGVGTGFKETPTIALREQLDRILTKKPAVELKRKNVVWVQPTLIAEIEYRAWTEDSMLRHASYKGLRDKQDNAEVYRIGEYRHDPNPSAARGQGPLRSAHLVSDLASYRLRRNGGVRHCRRMGGARSCLCPGMADRHVGVIAWMRDADPYLGEYGPPTVLFQNGDIPELE